jgi:sugar lactone lactonase YvrE
MFQTGLLLALLSLLASCARTPTPDLGSRSSTDMQLAWPAPPAPARIEFLREVSRPSDLGIEPGIWGLLTGWLVGTEDARLVRPTAVLMTDNEILYVADPGSRGVHRFDLPNRRHQIIRLDDDTGLRSPIALALGASNRVYVSDSAMNRIFTIDQGQDHAIPFPAEVDLDQPTGLALDEERLYVVNTKQHEVLVFDLSGKLLFKFARRGAGAGEFNYPTMIWIDPSTHELWVTDSLNFRLQRFDRDGQFLSAFGRTGDATGNLPRPKGIAMDSDGNLYVLDAIFNAMQIFQPTGELLLYLGSQGRLPGQFWLPTGIYIDGKDRIFIADSFNSRVQIFQYKGDKG